MYISLQYFNYYQKKIKILIYVGTLLSTYSIPILFCLV